MRGRNETSEMAFNSQSLCFSLCVCVIRSALCALLEIFSIIIFFCNSNCSAGSSYYCYIHLRLLTRTKITQAKSLLITVQVGKILRWQLYGLSCIDINHLHWLEKLPWDELNRFVFAFKCLGRKAAITERGVGSLQVIQWWTFMPRLASFGEGTVLCQWLPAV